MTIVQTATLSADGWLTSTASRCDALFDDFLSSAFSQYPQNKIEASLPYLITLYQDDLRGLETGCKNVLERYFLKTFPAVEVVVRAQDNPEDDTRADLYINLTVTDEKGLSFTLGKITTVGEGRVLRTAIMNNGTLPAQA
jgi:hypothetical protein